MTGIRKWAKDAREIAADDTHSGQVPRHHLSKEDEDWALRHYPELYWQVMQEHTTPINCIVHAQLIACRPPVKPTSNCIAQMSRGKKREQRQECETRERVGRFLEYRAIKNFSDSYGGILKIYMSTDPVGGCALTKDHRVHVVTNTTDSELLLYADNAMELCRNARRAFNNDVPGPKDYVSAPKGDIPEPKDDAPPGFKDGASPEATKRKSFKWFQWKKKSRERRRAAADSDRADVGEMLYSILTDILFTATIIADEKVPSPKKDETLAGMRAAWKTTREEVGRLIERQACFEYFQGVGWGAAISIPLLGLAAWAALHFGRNELSEPGEPASLSAAIMGGAAGAVMSVTQRMTSGKLKIDFTAPRLQKMIMGALRPAVGAVFGTVIYFIIVGGLLAVHADVTTRRDASIALAFFAVAGFAAGFSERRATDVLEKASSGILPTTRSSPADEKPEELSLLQSQQSRRAEGPTG